MKYKMEVCDKDAHEYLKTFCADRFEKFGNRNPCKTCMYRDRTKEPGYSCIFSNCPRDCQL